MRTPTVPVVLTGRNLTREDLVRVAQDAERVARGHGIVTAAEVDREHVPFLAPGATVLDVEGLVAAVRAGALVHEDGP